MSCNMCVTIRDFFLKQSKTFICSSIVVVCSAIFALVFFIAAAHNYATCEEDQSDNNTKSCFGNFFLFAILLLAFNVGLFFCLSRCFCGCFCHGFCHRWKRSKCQKMQQKLDNHPKLQLIYSLDGKTSDPDIVEHVQRLVQSTWLDENHHGADAKNLVKVAHTSMKIRCIYQINNTAQLAKYVISHLKNLKSHQLPPMLVHKPIKTTECEQTQDDTVHNDTTTSKLEKRRLSEISLAIQDVMHRTTSVILEGDENEENCHGNTKKLASSKNVILNRTDVDGTDKQVRRRRSSNKLQTCTISVPPTSSRDSLSTQVFRRLSLDLAEKLPRYATKRLSLQMQTVLMRPPPVAKFSHSRSKSLVEPIMIVSDVEAAQNHEKLTSEFNKAEAGSTSESRTSSTLSPTSTSPKNKVIFAFSFEEEGPLCYYMDSDTSYTDDETTTQEQKESTNQEPRSIKNDVVIKMPESIREDQEDDEETINEREWENAEESEKAGVGKRKKYKHQPLEIRAGTTREGEAYLFHGTRLANVTSIVEGGFRLDKSMGGLYGNGIYLAENSQKADQYADDPSNRRSWCLPMFVVRTSLGKVETFSREKREKLTHVDTFVAGKGKRFREYIKTDSNQCYPEFLIIYDRV